jgi:hypothetical protein
MIGAALVDGAVAQKPLFTAPLGIQTYTFRRSIGRDPAKVLDTIKMMGFTEIEGGVAECTPQILKNYVMKEVSVSHQPVPGTMN